MASGLSNERERLYWLIVVGVFVIAVTVIFFQNDTFYRDFQSYAPSTPMPSPAEFRLARLTIDFGDGSRRAFAGPTAEGMTILSALRLSASAGRFAAVADERGTVVAIAGLRNSRIRRWQVYLNDTPAADLPGHIELAPGDRIAIRYE